MQRSITRNGSEFDFEIRVFDGDGRKYVALIFNPTDLDLVQMVDRQAIMQFLAAYPEVSADEAEFLMVYHTENGGTPVRLVVTYNPDTSFSAVEPRHERNDLDMLVPVPEGEPALTSFWTVVEYCEQSLRAQSRVQS